MRFRSRTLTLPLAILGGLSWGGCLYEPVHSTEEEAWSRALVAEVQADQTGACTFSEPGGIKEIRVRATSQDGWTSCDLATGGLVNPAAGWDLGFQRFKVRTNSGSSGRGTGGACKTGRTDWDSVVTLAGSTGISTSDCPHFTADEPLIGETGGAGGSSVVTYSGSLPLREWFTYNIFGHTLTAKRDIFIVRSSESAKLYKIQFLDYYSAAGTSGYPRFRYQEISP